MFSSLSAWLVLLVAALDVRAVPLAGYNGAEASADASSSFSPLVAALSLVPLSLLIVLKYAYVRFRRAQSIHAHPHTSSPILEKSMSPRSSTSVSRELAMEPPSRFWVVVTPYLVGFLGSPEWETKIRSRLDKTLRQAKAESLRSRRSLRSLPYSPVLGDLSRTTANSSTAYYSSLSHKSRSRSKSLSVSFGDTSGDKPSSLRLIPHAYPAITDCAIIHPSSPPCQHGVFLPTPPPPAHTVQTHVRVSSQEYSPTLMQIMEPVLASWYDDTKTQQPTRNDTSQSSADSSRDKSGSSAESSLPFQTPKTSPPTPAMPGAFSMPPMPPFSVLRKQLGMSATSSILSLSATTYPSPTSVSIAVLHSPSAPSIRVPKPVYTPSLRPESCAVLPVDWQADRQSPNIHALLQSPTHRSPAPGRPSGILEVVDKSEERPAKSPKVSFSPVLGPPAPSPLSQSASAGPIILKSALKKSSSGVCTSPVLPSSLRNSVSFSMLSLEVPATGVGVDSAAASVRSSAKSWDLSDMMRDGQLDVDAVTRVLGLGFGMGLGLGSRSSVGSIGSAVSLNLAPLADNTTASAALQELSDGDAEYDVEQYAAGWGSPHVSGTGSESMQLRWHVPGMQLCAIPEESRSEVCSVAGGVHVPAQGGEGEGDGVVSMELDSGYVHVDGHGHTEGEVVVKRASVVQRESWKEGESVVTLSVGIAW
ncbi:hypothetical protein OH77DRAFT_1507353 [Trametes cingulata]|nr:hypothetical protein OH77DRAFT_1507353 [Trametes cingulata]